MFQHIDRKEISEGCPVSLHLKTITVPALEVIIMKCLKRIPCKSIPEACSQKRQIPIKVPVCFLFSVLIVLSMATVVVAQSKTLPQGSPTTQEEDRILNILIWDFDPYRDQNIPQDFKELEHYMRDGCKKSLSGYWRWDTWGDIVEIMYDEKYKVFLGKVKQPVKMGLAPGHILFKAYFPKNRGALPLPNKVDINWLRQQQQCKYWRFEGTELSFDQITRKKTDMKLILVLNGDQLEYKLEKRAWYLNRIR